MRRLFNTWGLALLAVLLLSLPVKLVAARLMPFDLDYAPVLRLGHEFLRGEGPFPVYGTLSSVAAYNMPMLPWLQIPALALTDSPFWTILLTQGSIGLLGALALYDLGRRWHPSVGLAAAALFSFSESGISGAYTAWAQLLLPPLFAMTYASLWRWFDDGPRAGLWLAFGGVLATTAFMTHFSAIMLYPSMLALALLKRARWHKSGLLLGSLLSLALLAPYLAFQAERDFIDLRAFLTRTTVASPEAIQQASAYKPENIGQMPSELPADLLEDELAENATTPTEPSRLERALAFALSVPRWIVQGFSLAFGYGTPVTGPLYALLALFFGLAALVALGQAIVRLNAHHRLLLDDAGLVLVGLFVVVIGLIATRATPDVQASYYSGLVGLQLLLAALGLWHFSRLLARRWVQIVALLGLASVGLLGLERLDRVARHDDATFTPQNAWLLLRMDETIAWIADDWRGQGAPRLAYDFMPQMSVFWWVGAWHSVDASYRIGMNYDYLLWARTGWHNPNQHPYGHDDQADYLITYPANLSRYPQAEIARAFGALRVLRLRAEG
ncbi:MAG: glycosyltransferase family 39 protein [Anaerolineae bacterium]|nr:glycosyltransferase family 39 protein [Anaerolineae bacterium]MDW8173655.1 glycosyltransferase family 39 protein [Anaerolineae bacterium]